ncbi:MAG: IS4 family transposase [Clostridia bacterium]|nr:IS4 family transposase [Clostridia bacterium]
MSHTRIVQLFSEAVNHVAENIKLYVRRPGADFTRNNKLPITKLLPFLVSQGSSSTKNELTAAYNFNADRPSASAFSQQRAKLKPKGMEELFHHFTTSLDEFHPAGKYRFLAADGSTLTFLSNDQLSPSEYYSTQGNSADGCHSAHAIAMYDLDTDIYTDCVIQPIRYKDEFGAFRDMVDRHPLPADGSALVFLADRGFCSYNNMAHVIERGQFFLFRAKDITSKGLLHHIDLPDSETFDMTIKFVIVRRQSSKLQVPIDGYRRFVGQAQSFDFVEYGSSDYYELSVRVVRFELSPGTFESLVTNLPSDEFPVEALKALYHRRWGIETSFRSLKYTIGLTKFHASKADFVLQEIWARLIAYNFTEAITHFVSIKNKPKNIHGYKVNFSFAVHVCRQFLRSSLAGNPIDVISLLSRELIPIRDERSYPRLQTAHFRKPAYFIYRPS